MVLPPPPDGVRDWLAVGPEPLPFEAAAAWAVRPDCGAVVVFAGTVRDHAEGRAGVTGLSYEVYEEQVGPTMAELAAEARRRWPQVGCLGLLHRVGDLALCDVSVLVVVSAPHRGEAFEAARWCIDTAKSTLPIWKRERWDGGEGWGTNARPLDEVRVAAP